MQGEVLVTVEPFRGHYGVVFYTDGAVEVFTLDANNNHSVVDRVYNDLSWEYIDGNFKFMERNVPGAAYSMALHFQKALETAIAERALLIDEVQF